MPVATDTAPPPLCSHLRGFLLAPATHVTGYQPIWRCRLCNRDIRAEDLLVPWAEALLALDERIAGLEAYWDQDLDLPEDLNDGR